MLRSLSGRSRSWLSFLASAAGGGLRMFEIGTRGFGGMPLEFTMLPFWSRIVRAGLLVAVGALDPGPDAEVVLAGLDPEAADVELVAELPLASDVYLCIPILFFYRKFFAAYSLFYCYVSYLGALST